MSSAIRPLLLPGKADLIPVEILSEIFLLVVQYWSRYQKDLMLVCRRWRAIVLLIPGITNRLWIRRSTKKEVVQAFIQGRRARLWVTVDVTDERDGKDFNAEEFHASFTAAVQVASRWHSLELRSFPPPREYEKPYTVVDPLKCLRCFRISQFCDLGSSFEPFMTAITTTTPPGLTEMDLSNIGAVLYLIKPAHLHVFHSLTTLTIKLSKRMESPADILPYLPRLERFHAQHLHLPIYSHAASLPLIQSLRNLFLKSASVQWMAGKVFPALQECSITFPHHINTICLRPVTMPACTSLTYDSNDLHALRCFHHPPLAELTVISGQWNVARGNPQLVAVCPIVVASAQRLATLDLQVQCSERLLVLLLSLVPALDRLVLRLTGPHSLSVAFFLAFVASNSNADSPCELAAPSRLPLCVNLETLEVHYKRWLRGPEREALIPVFSGIVSSRGPEAGFVLLLCPDKPVQYWDVQRPIESIRDIQYYEGVMIGISSPRGIIPLEWVTYNPLMDIPFKDAEYLVAGNQLSIGSLSTLNHLVELRLGDDQNILPTPPFDNLPLFHTLEVLEAKWIHPSFLAGQTFHKLEKCRMSFHGGGPKLSHAQVTEMPVCTKLDVDNLTLLATIKLPQIRELGASFDHPNFNMIWEQHIAVNVNLSGLELLHVYGWHHQEDLIQVLGCLPVLKSLILNMGNGFWLDADFFREFVPMILNENSAMEQSRDEVQKSVVLCPMLRSFLIEGFSSTVQLELVHVLNDIVTLRAEGGSPLNRFTLFDFALRRQFELIGSHGRFVVKSAALSDDYKPFRLDI